MDALLYYSWIHTTKCTVRAGKVRVSLRNRQRTVQDIKSLHRIDRCRRSRFRNDVQDHALDRSYKVIAEPKISVVMIGAAPSVASLLESWICRNF